MNLWIWCTYLNMSVSWNQEKFQNDFFLCCWRLSLISVKWILKFSNFGLIKVYLDSAYVWRQYGSKNKAASLRQGITNRSSSYMSISSLVWTLRSNSLTSPCVPGDRQQDQFIFLNDLTAYCQNVRNLFQIKKQFTDDDVMNMNIPVFRGIHCETEKVHRMDVRAPSNGETGTSQSIREFSSRYESCPERLRPWSSDWRYIQFDFTNAIYDKHVEYQRVENGFHRVSLQSAACILHHFYLSLKRQLQYHLIQRFPTRKNHLFSNYGFFSSEPFPVWPRDSRIDFRDSPSVAYSFCSWRIS